ncbi:MAG: aldolase/citrate lyase family protein [Planctomycetota bacterium]|nr:aldolase/citrate lyase family protein [Planctomycetota bacterium]MDA1178671.1 aldolase/citrate lyase family protein [Planctomycetota bacterium]
MRRNRLREILNNKQSSLGTRIMSFWPTTIELIGHSGMFDYVEFSAEYAPYDHQILDNLGRAIELFDHLTGMIKIEQESRLHAAVRAIGAGFQSVLFADPRSVADAQECVRVVRSERPQSGGVHGVNLLRSTGVVVDAASAAWADSLDNIVIALMIEKKGAIENLEAILSVPGIDMVQFGPADYSNSLGLTGQMGHPEVKAAEKYMIETALKMGVAPRVELNESVGFEPYLEMGVKHFNVGVDVKAYFTWLQKSGGILRKELGLEPLSKSAASSGGYGR